MRRSFVRFGVLLSAREGRQRGRIAGVPVSSPVEVLFDRYGIPHIYAENERDLFVAQGFMHARDRLWQMESQRRVVAGRLAEVAGPAVADLDHFSIVAGFGRLRDRAIAAADDRSAMMLDAYRDGINACIEHPGFRPPLEFRNLGVVPSRWSVGDLAAVLPLTSWFLETNYVGELVALTARERLDSTTYGLIYPSHPDAAIPLEPFFERFRDARIGRLLPFALAFYPDLRELSAVDAADSPVARNAAGPIDAVGPGAAPGSGSNGWVVRSGEGGRPLLANDPHLGISVPQTWHAVHLHSPGFNAAGVSMPGAPGLLIGRNENIAWGLTNLMTDITDLFMVRIDPKRPTRYRVGGDWKEMSIEHYDIPIRGESPRRISVFRTIYGPVITETAPGLDAAVALRTLGSVEDPAYEDTTLNGFLSLPHATSVPEAIECARLIRSVDQNLMVADSSGTIAWHPFGLVPMRSGYSGRCPADGSGDPDTGRDPDRWTSYLDFDDLPNLVNPPEGFIATANNRAVGAGVPEAITYYWCSSYRHDRIVDRLRALGTGDADLESMQEIQRDVRALQADRLLPALLAFDYRRNGALRCRDVLATWDREASPGSAGATVFAVFLVEFDRLLLSELLGPAFRAYQPFSRALYGPVDVALSGGDIGPLLIRAGYPADGLASLCEDALDRSFTIVTQALGPNPAKWRWGRLHTYRFAPAGATSRLANWLLSRGPYPAPGLSTTVNVSIYSPAKGSGRDRIVGTRRETMRLRRAEYGVVTIPSMRFTASMADPDRTFLGTPMGQSGRPGNRWYDNMIPMFLAGDVVPLPLSRSGVEKIARSRLMLTGT